VEVARRAGCEGRPVVLPQDECSAWAWLPLGASDSIAVEAVRAGAASEVRLAFGAAGASLPGFRRTHQQALGAHAVALAAGPAGPLVTSFTEVARWP
jgi:hypothetical protein